MSRFFKDAFEKSSYPENNTKNRTFKNIFEEFLGFKVRIKLRSVQSKQCD